MSAIKSTISLLCKALKLFCDVDIKTEDIRRAKFNQASDENVEIFWLVLYKLCIKLMGKGSNEYCTESLNVQVIIVKLYLAACGYKRVKFYHLPANCESGSQELLIALAWLLAIQSCFYKLICYKIRLFKQELKKYGKNKFSKSYHKGQAISVSYEDDLNTAMLLCGKLKQNTNSIYRLEQQNVNLLNKIHCETQGLPGLNHLSLCEVSILLEGSDELLKSAVELQNMISAHQKWRGKSCYFWKWMDTVLVEARLNSLEYSRNEHYLLNFLQVLITRLNRDSLEEASRFVNISPSPNFSSHTQEKKSLLLKILQDLLSGQIDYLRKAQREVKMVLQRQIKCIVYNTMLNAIFI